MRTLHIITGLSTGGAERALYNLLQGGINDTGEVAVLSLTNEGSFGAKIRLLGIQVYTLNMARTLPTPAALYRLRVLLKKFNPELIQGWMYHGNLAAIFAKWISVSNPAICWNIRQTLYSLSNEKLLTKQVIRANRLLSSYADRIIYNSHLSRKQHEQFGFDAGSGHVIPNGFDTMQLHPNDEIRQKVREMLDISPEQKVIGHVARFHPMKDHAGFLRAAVSLLESGYDVTFLLAGRHVGLDNPALQGIVPSNLSRHFCFIGERTDITDIMQALDVFCMSSAWGEAFPNVIAEAMSLEKPCVATDVGDSREIIGHSGEVVKPGDFNVLAQAMLKLLQLSEPALGDLGSQARERVRQCYEISGIVDQYRDLYKCFES